MTAPPGEPPDPVVAWPARYPLLASTVLACVLSWICRLPLLADRQGWVSWSASPYLHLPGGLGPAVAALAVTGTVAGSCPGPSGLRCMVHAAPGDFRDDTAIRSWAAEVAAELTGAGSA